MKYIRLNESQLTEIIEKVIAENKKYYDYSRTDYIDIALDVFKDWLKNTKKLTGKQPLSLLLNKYGEEFSGLISNGDESFAKRMQYSHEVDKLKNWGEQIVKIEYITDLPSLGKDEYFTEKFAKFLPRVIQSLNLPDWMTIKLEEPSPYSIRFIVDIDFPKMIKSKDTKYTDTYQVLQEFRKFLEKNFGITFGRVIDGNLSMGSYVTNFEGKEEWIKNVFNKQIKTEIKKLPHANDLHSVKFIPTSDGYKSELKIASKKWTYGGELRNEIRELLKSMGYNDLIRLYN